jgi:putative ABC transport system permease protein
MLSHYLTTALRSLRRQPGYAAVNVLGLAVGMAACLVIAVYVRHELSHDRFHEDAERIVRIVRQNAETGRARSGLPGAAAPAMVAERPEVEAATRVLPTQKALLRHEQTSLYDHGYRTDPAFFDVFSFEVLAGTPAAALDAPGGIVLTQSLAQKLLGDTLSAEQMLGAVVYPRLRTTSIVGEVRPFRVEAVVATPPSNSHLTFSFLVSLPEAAPFDVGAWTSPPVFHTYARLSSEAAAARAGERLGPWLKDHLPSAEGERFSFSAERLPEVYLSSVSPSTGFRSGSTWPLYVFGSVALVLFAIACVNYLNLSTVQAIGRAKEVGIRKATGASRASIARQFLGEAALMGGAAFVLALSLGEALLPLFDRAVVADVPSNLFADPALLGVAFAVILGLVLLTGSYPALYVSRFDPAEVFRSQTGRLLSGGALRKGLIVFQFAASVALVVGTLVMVQQLHFIRTASLGVDVENRLTLWLRQDEAKETHDVLEERLRQLPAVAQATMSRSVPARQGRGFVVDADRVPEIGANVSMARFTADANFPSVFGLTYVAGGLPASSPEAANGRVLLNASAVAALGWTAEEAVGRTVPGAHGDGGRVAGVVEDFHFTSMRSRIQPAIILIRDNPADTMNPVFLTLAITSTDPDAVLDAVRGVWSEVLPSIPFEYLFLDRAFADLHREDERRATLLVIAAGTALAIACVGLFGLMGFVVRRRRAEIGIRKALGSTNAQVVGLVLRQFAVLLGAALLLALPLSYLGARQWLRSFAYHVDLGPAVFAVAVALVLSVTALTVTHHALHAARLNPATTLRDE